MASLFKKKTVDGEFQARPRGPPLCGFPAYFRGFRPRFSLLSLRAGLDPVAPQVTALARHYSASPAVLTRLTSASLGLSGFFPRVTAAALSPLPPPPWFSLQPEHFQGQDAAGLGVSLDFVI